jgi:ADP-ribose pyrophosphatase
MASDFESGDGERYLLLMRERPELFANKPNSGIEVLTTPEHIRAAQDSARQARQVRGLDVSDLRVGVLATDPYMTIMRDAVRFPDGTLGLYNRIVEVKSVAVLPLLEGQPVLIRIFRHGLRDWSWEFPRGGCDPEEHVEKTVRRELQEEIGANVIRLVPLGDFTPGGSSLCIRAELFAAQIDGIGRPDRGDGIGDIKVFAIAEVERMIRSSDIFDGFSLSLFLRARLAGIV